MEIEVAGRKITQEFAPAANQVYTFTWDGLDGYGRSVPGTQPIKVRTGYVYDAFYYAPSESAAAFANFSNSIVTGNPAREEITLWTEWRGKIGALGGEAVGLGGWTLDVHHAYDAVARTLYYGDGRRRSTRALETTVITTFAGQPAASLGNGDGGPAVAAMIHRQDGGAWIEEFEEMTVDKDAKNSRFAGLFGSVN